MLEQGNDAFTRISQIMDTLIRLLTYSDQNIVDSAAKSLGRIAEWSTRNPEKMEELFNPYMKALIDAFVEYSDYKQTQTNAVLLLVLETLAKIVKNCPALASVAIKDIHILKLIRKTIVSGDHDVIGFAVSRPPQQVLAILDFLSDVLPPLEPVGVWMIGEESTTSKKENSSNVLSVLITNATLDDHALQEYVDEIFPAMFDVYMTSSSNDVKKKVVACVIKVIQSAPSVNLKIALEKAKRFGKFVFELIHLHQSCVSVDVPAPSAALREIQLLLYAGLAISVTVLNKCGSEFSGLFHREGVSVELEKLLQKSSLMKSIIENKVPFEGPSDSSSLDGDSARGGDLAEMLQDFISNVSVREGAAGLEHEALTSRLLNMRQTLLGSQTNQTKLIGFTKERFSAPALLIKINTLAEMFLELSSDLSMNQNLNSGLVKTLEGLVEAGVNGNKEEVTRNLRELSDTFTAKQTSDLSCPLTNFELFSSKLVDIMIDFLTSTGTSDENHIFPSSVESRLWSIALKERIMLFMDIFFESGDQGLSILLSHFHEYISRMDQFTILSASTNETQYPGRMESLFTIGQFSKQVRLTLVPEDSSHVPSSLHLLEIAIPAIASFKTVESYIFSRIQGRPTNGSVIVSDSLIDVTNDDEEEFDEEQDEDEFNISDSPAIVAATEIAILLEKSTSQASSASLASRISAAPSLKVNKPVAERKKYIVFMREGVPIPTDTTVFGCAYFSLSPGQDCTSLWRLSHSLTYKIVDKKPIFAASFSKKSKLTCSCEICCEIYSDFGHDLDITPMESFKQVLFLVSILNSLNSHYSLNRKIKTSASVFLSPSSFVNNKLTAKLARQIAQPLICVSAIHPSWAWSLLYNYSFLFPFDVRLNVLKMTALGYSRNMAHWTRVHKQSSNQGGQSLESTVRAERIKVRISRDSVFESMVKVMNMDGYQKSILEVEFFKEVGSGLGPTLEFYTLVSKSIRLRKGLRSTPTEIRQHLWRDDEGVTEEHLNPVHGLYPMPYHSTNINLVHVNSLFSSLGAFVGKAFLDSRRLDIQFSPVFIDQVFHPVQGNSIGVLSALKKIKVLLFF